MASQSFKDYINHTQTQKIAANTKDNRKYLPPTPLPPNFRNNPLLEAFQQPSNGFGVSNFRIEQDLPTSINRTSTDLSLEDAQQETNPLGTYMFQRHCNFLYRDKYADYKNIVDESKVPDDYIYWDIIKNVEERNPLMDFFFSKKNLDHLQNLIINMISHQSDGSYKISRQSDSELLTVMRGIYIQTPKNNFAEGKEFKNEICKINKNVLDFVVPKLIVNIQGYLGFVRDNGNDPMPHAQPEFLSSAGQRINSGFDVTFI
jgi:hypothetical protein